MTDNLDPRRHRGDQDKAAGDVGIRRLRRDRHDACRSSASRCARRSTWPPDRSVLDVAAGNGNASLAAARRGGDVTATDYVEALLDRARRPGRGRRAAARRPRSPTPRTLPFEDAHLRRRAVDLRRDVHAEPRARPRPSCSACAGPGGRIGLANWTPEGFVGQMFKIVGAARAAARRRPLAAGVGHRGPAPRAVRRRRRGRRSPAASSPSASGRPRTSSRRSRPTTGPTVQGVGCARRRPGRRRSASSSSPWPTAPTATRAVRWPCRRSTSRSWRRGSET